MQDGVHSDATLLDARTVTFATKGQLLRWVPINTFSSEGTLRLEGGRLTFSTLVRHRVKLDVPVDEVHSFAFMTKNSFHFWHGTTRYRFAVVDAYAAPAAHGSAVGVAMTAASLPGRFRADRSNRDLAAQWGVLLRQHPASPPDGLRVRKPMPSWGYIPVVIGTALALMGAVAMLAL